MSPDVRACHERKGALYAPLEGARAKGLQQAAPVACCSCQLQLLLQLLLQQLYYQFWYVLYRSTTGTVLDLVVPVPIAAFFEIIGRDQIARPTHSSHNRQ
jgi:hypothetical protein